MVISHLSLLCSPKKSHGSTIPRSLQPWPPGIYSEQKIALQRRVKLDLALVGVATTQDDKIKIRQASLSSKN